MALINCPECKSEVSDQAKTCPKCGIEISKDMNIDKLVKNISNSKSGSLKGCLYLFLTAIGIFILFMVVMINLGGDDKKTATSTQTQTTSAWYKGGTLHKAKIKEWKAATPINRLATAADMALASDKVKDIVEKSKDMNSLKPFAKELTVCIDKGTVEKIVDNWEVAEVAATCMILMGWR